MGRVKRTFIVSLVISALITAFVVVYICMRILRGRRKSEVIENEEEEDNEVAVDSYQRSMQRVIVAKTPLAVQSTQDFSYDGDRSADKFKPQSQSYDQAALWKNYQNINSVGDEECCSVDNGRIKVEFYHQSYSQLFKMKVVNASGLKCNGPNKNLNTRVKILLVTPLKTRHIPRKTRVVKDSNDPDFNQVIDIKLTRKTAHNSTVEVSIWNIDDFFRESLIGGVVIDLKKYDIGLRNSVEEEIQIDFEEYENPGYLMVSLGYNEKEEKLIAIAMRGKMLKCSTKEDTILKETINPYIKVYLYCDQKKIKKEKTEMKIGQINPVFNHVMEFLVPKRTLPSTNLIFVVMEKDARTDSKRNIGRIVIGANSNGRCWEHWKSAITEGYRVTAQWHQLWQ